MAGAVLGRDSEQQRLSRFLESLQPGPAACVLEGEAGVGKTALWRDGLDAARATEVRVLACAPAEVEAAACDGTRPSGEQVRPRSCDPPTQLRQMAGALLAAREPAAHHRGR